MKQSVKTPLSIAGAGLKGLALSFFLKQHGIPTIIYEKSARPGGWIRTDHSKGFLFETGPRGFRPVDLTLELVHSLQLSDQLLYPDKAAGTRFIYSNKRLNSLISFFPRLGLGLAKDLFTSPLKPEEVESMSIKEYFQVRLGSYCTHQMIDPLVSGIYAGDISKLSAKLCFPSMTHKGSVLRSMFTKEKGPKHPLISFKKGMQTLTDRLAEEAQIIYNSEIESPDFDCTPLTNYSYESVIAVNMGWKNAKLPKNGFGYLIPQSEKEEILGVVFDSSTFPQQNNFAEELRLTVMMGGAHHPHLLNLSEDQIKNIATNAIRKHLNISNLPNAITVNYAKNAIAQPLVGSQLKGVGINAVIEEAYRMGNGYLQK